MQLAIDASDSSAGFQHLAHLFDWRITRLCRWDCRRSTTAGVAPGLCFSIFSSRRWKGAEHEHRPYRTPVYSLWRPSPTLNCKANSNCVYGAGYGVLPACSASKEAPLWGHQPWSFRFCRNKLLRAALLGNAVSGLIDGHGVYDMSNRKCLGKDLLQRGVESLFESLQTLCR